MKLLTGMNTLKAGDTVHFRCGGKAVVSSTERRSINPDVIWISFRSHSQEVTTGFYVNGRYYNRQIIPWDIIKITKRKP